MNAVKVTLRTIKRTDPRYLRLVKELAALKGAAYVKAGYLGSEMVGPPGEITTPQLAAAHEFGVPPRLPARPHVGPAFDRNLVKLEKLLAVLLQRWFDGQVSLQQALGLLGLQMVNDIRSLVMSGTGVPPPNAPSTLERKLAKTREGSLGVPRTLVDTGRMVGALTHLVMLGRASRPRRQG